MPGTTPQYGFTYPIATDPLDDAVSAIPQTLATDVENTLLSLYGGGIPGAGWTNLPLAANWTVNAASRYSKSGARVYVEGYTNRATSSFASGGALTTALPAGYRPAALHYAPALVSVGGTLNLAMIQLNTSGILNVLNSGGAAIAVGASLLYRFDFPTN